MNQRRFTSITVVGLTALAWGSGALPAALASDLPPPAHVAPYVDSAREALDRDTTGQRFRFVTARCRSDGGSVLVFEQSSFPWVGVRYAYAASLSWPPTVCSANVGDSEDGLSHALGKFLGSDQNVPCPS
jgi:hypothetical protein